MSFQDFPRKGRCFQNKLIQKYSATNQWNQRLHYVFCKTFPSPNESCIFLNLQAHLIRLSLSKSFLKLTFEYPSYTPQISFEFFSCFTRTFFEKFWLFSKILCKFCLNFFKTSTITQTYLLFQEFEPRPYHSTKSQYPKKKYNTPSHFR